MRNTAKTIGNRGIEAAAGSGNAVADSYLELIEEFRLRRIKTAGDHGRAKRVLLRLSGAEGDRGTRDYMEVLVDLVTDFESRAGQVVKMAGLSMADLVRHRLEERGMSVSAAARKIGVAQSNLSEMLSGRRGWSKAAIRGLGAMLNIRAERFLEG